MSYNNLPTISKNSIPLVKSCESKYYTFYSASADAFTNQVNGTKYDVSLSSGGTKFSDDFNPINFLPSTAKAISCDGGSGSTSSISTTSGSKTTGWGTQTTTTTSTTEPTKWTTTTVTSYTTFCPGPTTFTHGTKTFTVTEATTLTITDCPCEITVPWKPATTASVPGTTVSDSIGNPTTSTVDSPQIHNPAPVSSSPVGALPPAPPNSAVNPAGSTTKPAAVATFTGAATPGKRADLLLLGALSLMAYLI